MRIGKKNIIALALVATMSAGAISPTFAQSRQELEQRQKMKNEWRNIAYLAGALGVYGLLKDDKTLFFAGTIGALYAADRYEKDRKSQNKMERLRAEYFSRPYFYRDGTKYVRHTAYKNGKKVYYFSKVRR